MLFPWSTVLKFAVPILVVGAAVFYINHLHSYKEKYESVQKQFDDYKAAQEKIYERYETSAEEITKKYKEATSREQNLIEDVGQLNKERILLAKELNDIKLSRRVVELFNGTVASDPDEAYPPSSTIEGNARETRTTEESTTLQELLIISNENRTNHLKCIKQVEMWQNFWSDYASSR